MITEPYPIELYISAEFHNREVGEILLQLNLEPEELKVLVVSRFIEMGIYAVNPGLEEKIHDQIIFILKTDPVILAKVRETQDRLDKRRDRKHSA